jgi:hypothetical protein
MDQDTYRRGRMLGWRRTRAGGVDTHAFYATACNTAVDPVSGHGEHWRVKETEYLKVMILKEQHTNYHTRNATDPERRRRLLKIHICEVAHHNLCIDALGIDIGLANLALNLSHRATIAAHPAADAPWG